MLDLLQLRVEHARVEAALDPLPPPPHPGFVTAVDAAMARLRAGRRGWWAALDRRLRTDRPEQMDDPGLPTAERVRLVHDLHRHNQLVGTYRRFASELHPLVRAVARDRQRPARLLELASGSGAFATWLARHAARRRLPVEVTGSDIVPAYVDEARERAVGTGARFVVLDATRLDGLAPGAFDLVFLGQAAHHFSPGLLASMVAAAGRVATTAMLVVDGRRSLALFPLLAATNALLPRLRHDSFLSARKFYTEPELSFLGRAGAPWARVEARPSHPGYSVLIVQFAG